MATIEDLEAQLREDLDRDTVAVYGDQLQALGDPRGELIAIDLEIEQSGSTPVLARRRAELVESWLGQRSPNGAIRYGFIDVDATSADPVAQVKVAFEGPAARYVRSVTIVGAPRVMREAIAVVAALPRPSLIKLVVRQWSERDTPTIDKELSAAVVRATPHLQRLELDAQRLFADFFMHPTLRTLRISGFGAIGSFPGGDLALPALAELDLALQCHLASTKAAPPPLLFDTLGAWMSKLEVLDLSRNEPGYLDPHTLGGDFDLFANLPRLGCAKQLRSLTVPAPPDPNALASLRSALATMWGLNDLAIVRTRAADHAALSSRLARDGLSLRFTT